MNTPLHMLSKTEMSEKYIGILQPLEALVSICYSQHTGLHDHDVLRVYEAHLKYFRAKLTNFPLPQHNLKGISSILYEQQHLFLEEMQKSYSLAEIQQCLKQLEKSVKLWNKEHGSRGYLNFISQFL